MFTVPPAPLERHVAGTLTTTNCVESMISVARTTMLNVKHWQDGEMEETLAGCGYGRGPAPVQEGRGL